MWGAARHDIATGVHRPLYADVLALAPTDGAGQSVVRAQLDLVGLAQPVHTRLVGALAEGAACDRSRVDLTFSHTHSAGWLNPPDRYTGPGGALVGPYLARLEEQ